MMNYFKAFAIAALVTIMAPVAHADFDALTQMPMPTATAYTTGLVTGVVPAATNVPSLVNEPAAITDGYDATSGSAALGAQDATPIDGSEMPAAGSFDPSNMPAPAMTNEMPAYGSFNGGSGTPAITTGSSNQTFQTMPVPDSTPSVSSSSSSGSSSKGKTYGGMKPKSAPVATTTLTQMATESHEYAPMPIISEAAIAELPGTDAHDYEASVRNIGIAVNLATILAIIVAFMAAVVGYREYQNRKTTTATEMRAQEIARMTA